MRKIILFAALLFVIRADDYFLDEEEEQEMTKEPQQDNFMKQYTCLIAVQRFTSMKTTSFQQFQDQGKIFETNLKRVKARLYGKCLTEVTEEVISAVQKSTKSTDFDAIDFGTVYTFDFESVFREEEPKISEDDKTNYRGLLSIEDSVREIQKKNRRENPDKDEDDEDDMWQEIRKKRSTPTLSGHDLKSKPVILAVSGCFLIFGLFIYKISSKLFQENKKEKKSKKVKKQN